jgi:CubicO group peptidase (beta-lactamase class C family)
MDDAFTPELRGTVEPGFEGVQAAFLENFIEGLDDGASFAVYVDGREVVNIAAGVKAHHSSEPYDVDTPQIVFSSTKGLVAICANMLAERGLLDIEAPVTEYWPEYGGAGKGDTIVKWLLTHQAGMPIIDAPLTLEQVYAWDPVIDAIAHQEPQWEPGTAHGYHALSYGWLVGEVIRRVSGKTVGTFFADEVAAPLGLEAWIGLPDEQLPRVAPFPDPRELENPEIHALIEQFLGPDMPIGRALFGPGGAFRPHGVINTPGFLQAEIPAGNGVTNARSLARAYAACIGEIDGVRLLGPEQMELARIPRTEGNDRILIFESKIGLGFFTHSAFSPYGGARSFGHTGLGGSCGFADPEAGLAFGYVMNKALPNLAGDPRTARLTQAAYAAIGLEPAPV